MNRIGNAVRRMREGQGGFTLLELMIAIVVVAVLASIAYPTYQTSVRKGKRGQAKSDVLAAAQIMERCFTQQNSYLLCWGGDNTIDPPYNQSVNGTDVTYTIALPVVAQGAYTITATPVGDQANDTCGTLSLDQAGRRTFSGSGSNCF